jgi:hypothetical protein
VRHSFLPLTHLFPWGEEVSHIFLPLIPQYFMEEINLGLTLVDPVNPDKLFIDNWWIIQ